MKYQTRIRRSADTAWPLRRADGTTWAQKPVIAKHGGYREAMAVLNGGGR